VFLILPDYINRLTGLRVRADVVIQRAIGAVEDFLGLRPDNPVKIDADNKVFIDGEHAVRAMPTGGGRPAQATGQGSGEGKTNGGGEGAEESAKSPTVDDVERRSEEAQLEKAMRAVALDKVKDEGGEDSRAELKVGMGKVRYDRVYEPAGREERAGERLARPIARPGELVKHRLPASA
jgi:hypothetical protein